MSAWILLSGVLAAIVARRLLGGQRSLEAAARRVEAEFPELGNSLINLVQLSEDAQNASPAFREAAIREAAAQIGDLPLDRAPARESRPRRLLHCMQTPRDLAESLAILALLIAVAVLCQTWIPAWGSTVSRLSSPWKFVPSVGSVKIVRVTPGNAEVLVGESVEIAAEIENPDAKPHRAWLFVAGDAEPESKLAMTADKRHLRYKATVPSVLKPFRYRLEIGDSQTEQYSIGVREKPVIENAEITFRYPGVSRPQGRNGPSDEPRHRGAAIHRGELAAADFHAGGRGLSGDESRASTSAASRRRAGCWPPTCRCSPAAPISCGCSTTSATRIATRGKTA